MWHPLARQLSGGMFLGPTMTRLWGVPAILSNRIYGERGCRCKLNNTAIRPSSTHRGIRIGLSTGTFRDVQIRRELCSHLVHFSRIPAVTCLISAGDGHWLHKGSVAPFSSDNRRVAARRQQEQEGIP